MARRKNWLDRLKKFLTSETQSKQEKKERRRRWLFGKLKSKFSPALPPPSLQRLRSLREAEQEQSKHAVAVAVATAAAAEAAVAAAQAAARVVRLTGNPLHYKKTKEVAAVKIQTAFRGYLARRALRALKGLVKLQALIRGQAVRRQTNTTLKGLQSLMKIQSQARANRLRIAANRQSREVIDVVHVKQMQDRENGNTQAQYNDKRWDNSILSKAEIIALLTKRQNAAFKRERAMDYASAHQEARHAVKPTTSISDHDLGAGDPSTKLSWLENWVGTQPLHKDIHEVLAAPFQDQVAPNQHLHASETPKTEDIELIYQARRSFNQSERARSKDDESFSGSSCFPSYMASTASTKAKFRSVSTPKQRRKTLDCYEHCSVSNDRPFSPLSSVKSHLNHQRSPRLRDSFETGKLFNIHSENKCNPVR